MLRALDLPQIAVLNRNDLVIRNRAGKMTD